MNKALQEELDELTISIHRTASELQAKESELETVSGPLLAEIETLKLRLKRKRALLKTFEPLPERTAEPPPRLAEVLLPHVLAGLELGLTGLELEEEVRTSAGKVRSLTGFATAYPKALAMAIKRREERLAS